MDNMEGSKMHKRNLIEEMREFGKLRTAVMMEVCLSKSEVVMCPKPRRRHMRQFGELTELSVGSELSDLIVSKASPPYYSVSPPSRASNPLIQDARFREQRVQQTPSFSVRTEGVDIVVDRAGRTQSISTMA